jgi:hypothetical protein
MESRRGPFSGPAAVKIAAANTESAFQAFHSGELTASQYGKPLGAVTIPGKITDVALSVGASGKDDSNPLRISGEVYINGASCLTTPPSIAHVSGEASAQKTTLTTGDTGIGSPVINLSANEVLQGDVLTCDLILDRTATPTTEISSVVLMVMIEPSY